MGIPMRTKEKPVRFSRNEVANHIKQLSYVECVFESEEAFMHYLKSQGGL